MMKSLFRIPKKGIAISAMLILLTGGLVLGLPANSDGCGESCGCRSAYNSDVDIPLTNNHYPKIARISKIYIEVPGECHHSNHHDDIRVKVISFGETAYYDRSPDGDSHCCCRNQCHGHEYTLDTSYNFFTTKATCTVTLDVSSAPSGNYTIKCFYEVPPGAGNGAWGKELTYTYTP